MSTLKESYNEYVQQDKSIKEKEIKIALLKRAKHYVQCGTARGICAAITGAEDWIDKDKYGGNTYKLGFSLVNYISNALGEHSYLESWVVAQQGFHIRDDKRMKARMKATRLAWIDWMISCLQEDVDKLRNTPLVGVAPLKKGK